MYWYIKNNLSFVQALVCTGNKSLDAALAWIAELGAEEMEALCDNSDNGWSQFCIYVCNL